MIRLRLYLRWRDSTLATNLLRFWIRRTVKTWDRPPLSSSSICDQALIFGCQRLDPCKWSAVVHFEICGGASTINRSTVTRFRHLRVFSAYHSERDSKDGLSKCRPSPVCNQRVGFDSRCRLLYRCTGIGLVDQSSRR